MKEEKKLKALKVTIRFKGENGAPGVTQTIPLDAETLDSLQIEREYADGHKEDRQVFPTNTTYQPAPPAGSKPGQNTR